MRVLYICSGNHGKLHHGTHEQITSLVTLGVSAEIFMIKGKGFWGYLKNIQKLRNKIEEIEPDLVHVIGGFCGLATFLTFRKIKICISYLGSDLQGNPSNNIIKLLLNKLVVTLIRYSSYIPEKVIVKSKKMSEHLPKRNLCKTYVVPNGVNFSQFKPININVAKTYLNLELNVKYLLFLGNKKLKNKNFPLIKNAYTRINDSKIRLLAPYPISNSLIPYYLNASEVLILTSFNEGSPNVIKEAMACNCPIISMDVGDVKSVINGAENCFITNYDSNTLANIIIKCVRNGSRSNGRSKIEHLRTERIAEKILLIYKNMIS